MTSADLTFVTAPKGIGSVDDNGLYTSSAGTGDGGVITGRDRVGTFFAFGGILCCVFWSSIVAKAIDTIPLKIAFM